MAFEKKELKGRMWKEQSAQVVWKGPVHIEGQDKYMTIIKTEVSGQTKFECLVSVGLLYLKDDPTREKAPDIGGTITVPVPSGMLKSYKFGGWEEVNPDSGETSLSVGLLVPDSQYQSPPDGGNAPADAGEDENIPF